jgi:hypothetical protein
MKIVCLMAMSLAVGVSHAPRAERQVPKELEPSLRFLQGVSSPMPDFRKAVFYLAVPDSQGNLVAGIGHSDFVKGWFRQMEPMVPKFRQSEDRLKLDIDVYEDTVREEGDKVLTAAANLKAALTQLDKVTAGKLQDLLAEYNDQVKATRAARSEFLAATKKAEEAKFLVESTDAGAKECNLLLEKTKLETEKAALLAKMQRAQAFLNTVQKAIQSMAGGPQGVASYVTGELTNMTVDAAKTILVEAFYSSTRETLYEIGMKIEAIDKSLQDVKCKQQSAALQAAKSNLEARMIQVLLAFGGVLDHRAKAWRAVDRLATLQDPKTGRKLPFFQNLQTYNAQVNLMGRKIFDSVNSHLDLLSREPLSRGPLLAMYVDEDVATVTRDKQKRDPSGTWSRMAGDTSTYLDRYTRWYQNDVKRGQTVLEDLREGRHLDFVDRMVARATKDLGGTVSYEDIIR